MTMLNGLGRTSRQVGSVSLLVVTVLLVSATVVAADTAGGPVLLVDELSRELAAPNLLKADSPLPTKTVDGKDWRAPAMPTGEEADSAPQVPEPAAAAMLVGLGGLVLLMTILRWRFDQMSAAPAPLDRQR